jgi:cytochrome c-type biogenesis protein CcmH/NrfF
MGFFVVGLMLLAFATPVFGSVRHPTRNEVESLLTCPTCKGRPLASDRRNPVARQMDLFIQRAIRRGCTETQIIDYFVRQFGPSVRLVHH